MTVSDDGGKDRVARVGVPQHVQRLCQSSWHGVILRGSFQGGPDDGCKGAQGGIVPSGVGPFVPV
jgi:hypothetical protein